MRRSVVLVALVTDQNGNARSRTFTPNGDIATTTDATAANTTTNTYDGNNNPTKTQLPTGAAAQAFYAAGTNCPGAQSGHTHRPKCTMDAGGNKSSIEYDAAGNTTKVTDTTSSTAVVTHQYTYDSNGSVCGGKKGQVCTAKDGNGNTTAYTYSNGNLTKVTPPSPLGATTYGYDSLGRVTSVKDGNGKTTTYGYDQRDRITTTTYHDTSKVLTAYNADGTRKSESDSAAAVVMQYTYNLLNQPTKHEVQTATPGVLVDTATMAYDASGNLLTYKDAGGTVAYTYDPANRLTKLVDPGGACPASGTPAAGSGCTLFKYDTNNVEKERVFPGGARVGQTVDASGRVTRITAKNASGAVVSDIQYSFTAAGQSGQGADRTAIQSRTSTKEQGIAVGAVTSYSYDSQRRLTLAEEKAGSSVTASWKYTYDKVGNRTSQVVAGSSLTASNTTYTYNAANQLVTSSADTTTWTYDGAGNQTRNGITGLTTTYGVRLNITGMGTKTYSSFAQGNTIGLNVDGGTQLLNTPIGVSRSWTSSSDRQNYSRTADGSPVGYRDGAGQARNYYVTDHLGSVVAVFNASGATVVTYSYAPYGELRAQSSSTAAVTNDLRYTGGLKVGDLYKFGARYYDPAIGRFTQMDPSGREKNPYAYAACNPINATDPTGLVTEDCMAAGLGLVSSIVGIAASIVGLVFSLAATVPSFGASAILGIASVAGLSAGAVGTILSLRGIMNDC